MSKYELDLKVIYKELYNAVYDSKKKDDYSGQIVNIKDTKIIENIKYDLTDEDNDKFLKNNFKNAKFKFTDIYINNVLFQIKLGNTTFEVHVKPYFKKFGIDNIESVNNLSKRFAYYVGQLATLNQGQIAELHLMNIDIKYSQFVKYVSNEIRDKLEFYEDMIQSGEIEEIISVEIVENYFKKKIPLNYFDKDIKKYKIFIAHVLAKLVKLRDNLDNIFIKKLYPNNFIIFCKKGDKSNIVKLKDKLYELPSSNFDIRFRDMNDFEFCSKKLNDSDIIKLVKDLIENIERVKKIKFASDLFYDDLNKLFLSLNIKKVSQSGGKKSKKKKFKTKVKQLKKNKEKEVIFLNSSEDSSSENNYSTDLSDNENSYNITIENKPIKNFDINDFNKMVGGNESEIALNNYDYPNDMKKIFKEGNVYNELVSKGVDKNVIDKVMNAMKSDNLEINNLVNEKKVQKGGGGRIIPMYDAKRNDPYKTFEDKKVQFDKIEAQNQVKEESTFEPPQKQPMPQRRQKLVHEDSERGPSRGPPRGPSRGPPRGPPRNQSFENYSINREGNNSNGPTINIQVGDSKPGRPPRPPPRPPPVAEFVAPPIPQVGPYAYPYLNVPMTQPSFMKQPAPIVIKKSMNISNPIGNNEATHNIFEDLLPTSKRKFYFSSLEDREVQYDFFRNILVKEVEGDEVSLGYDKTGVLNLSSVLKVLEINPFYSRLLHPNKYASLPENMLFFSACYPIEVNRERQRIDCAKHAMGVNLRLYSLSQEQTIFLGQKVGDFNNGWNEHSVWRDVYFYKFMRENVLLRKKSPNFLLMYSYHVADDYYVDFRGLQSVANMYSSKLIPKLWKKHRNYVLKNYKKMLENDSNFNKLEDGNYFQFLTINSNSNIRLQIDESKLEHVNPQQLDAIKRECRKYRSKYYTNLLRNNDILPHERNTLNVINQDFAYGVYTRVDDTDIQLDANKMLCVLTESPTYTIQDWCTRLYRVDDKMYMRVNTMGETGYHRSEVWYTVLFQIMIITKVLFDYDIVMENLKSTNNSSLFIKDLNYNDNFAKGFYKYKVGNINYFVPNYGSLVVFDPFPRRPTPRDPIFNDPIGNIGKCSNLDDESLSNFRKKFIKLEVNRNLRPNCVLLNSIDDTSYDRINNAYQNYVNTNLNLNSNITFIYKQKASKDHSIKSGLYYTFANAFKDLLESNQNKIPTIIEDLLSKENDIQALDINTLEIRNKIKVFANKAINNYYNDPIIKSLVDNQIEDIQSCPGEETISLLSYTFGVCIRVWKINNPSFLDPTIMPTPPIQTTQVIYPRNFDYNSTDFKIDLIQITSGHYNWLKHYKPGRPGKTILVEHQHIAPTLKEAKDGTSGRPSKGKLHYHNPNTGNIITGKNYGVVEHDHSKGKANELNEINNPKMAEGGIKSKLNVKVKNATLEQKGGAGLLPLVPINAKPLYPVYKDWQFGNEVKKLDPKVISEGTIPDLNLVDHKFSSMYSNTLFNDKEYEIDCLPGNKFLDNIRKLVGLEWMNIQFKRLGGVECPTEIRNFTSRIISYIEHHRHKVKRGGKLKEALPKELYPENIICKFFRRFMHNKIGSEVQYFDKTLKTPSIYDFKKGDIVAYLDKGVYRWGLVKEDVEEKYEYKDNVVHIQSKLKIIKNNKDNEFEDDEINKYYCKVPVDINQTPLNVMSSREGGPKMIEYYNVDLM